MADRMKEYNRGRDQGLDMAYRLLRDAGENKAAGLIRDEIKARGKTPVKLAITSKELTKGLEPLKWCMYETFMCMALMVLHDEFGFAKKRCLRFLDRWNLKTDCLSDGLVNWSDMIKAVKDDVDIEVPTACMRQEGLI